MDDAASGPAMQTMLTMLPPEPSSLPLVLRSEPAKLWSLPPAMRASELL